MVTGPVPFVVEVYVDEKKAAYRTLGYKQFGWLSIIKALLSYISRGAISEVKEGGEVGRGCGEVRRRGGGGEGSGLL